MASVLELQNRMEQNLWYQLDRFPAHVLPSNFQRYTLTPQTHNSWSDEQKARVAEYIRLKEAWNSLTDAQQEEQIREWQEYREAMRYHFCNYCEAELTVEEMDETRFCSEHCYYEYEMEGLRERGEIN